MIKKSNKIKYLFITILTIIIALIAYKYYPEYNNTKQDITNSDENISHDYKNTTYTIDKKEITLKNGYSEIEISPNTSSKIITKYFGNDLKTDINSDGKEDIVFIITQESGGSGIFYYVVAAINSGNKYIGSDAYYIGDRIAPQSINKSQNSKHKDVIVVNYAERAYTDPMTTKPNIGKSLYLKIDQDYKWGIVYNNFEGETK